MCRPDFPFYADKPVPLRAPQWATLFGSLALAFVLLSTTWLPFNTPWMKLIPAVLFCVVPLACLAMVAGRHWTALFRKPGTAEMGWMAGIAVLNLAVTLMLGLAFSAVHQAASNPVFERIKAADAQDRMISFVAMAPQLLGEELLTILPFLACLWLFSTRLGIRRRGAIVSAWLVSALPFALIHLPTYDWNIAQCLVVIGGARLVLSLAYLVTRNLWVSTGAHLLNDWALLGAGMLLTSAA